MLKSDIDPGDWPACYAATKAGCGCSKAYPECVGCAWRDWHPGLPVTALMLWQVGLVAVEDWPSQCPECGCKVSTPNTICDECMDEGE